MQRQVAQRLVVLLLGAFIFLQASVVLAFCGMDTPASGRMTEHPPDDCCSLDTQPAVVTANLCVAHCTSDFQTVGEPALLVGAYVAPVLFRPGLDTRGPLTGQRRHPPPPAVPRRILFQSFLI